MKVSVSPRERDRLVRALYIERRQDGLLDLTLLRLDPGQQSSVLHQTMRASDHGVAALADGAPAFDTRGIAGFPPGFWPARRTAGGWVALIDEPSAKPRRTVTAA
jgi:hypothetical protein